jgi:hypothetical protein
MSEFSIPPGDAVDQYTEVVNGRKRVFTLSETHVHVRMTQGLGALHDVRIPLEWLTPDYGTGSLRSVNLRWVGMSLALIFLPLTLSIYADAKPPNPWFFIAITLAAVGVILALVTLVTAFIPRRFYRFANSQGVFILDVIAVGAEKRHCEQFADHIRERILVLRQKPSESL